MRKKLERKAFYGIITENSKKKGKT